MPENSQPVKVEVELDDLDAWRAALNSAYFHQSTYDMMQGYRDLETNIAPSPMTTALSRALESVVAYMQQAADEAAIEEEPADEPVQDEPSTAHG